MTSSTPLLRGLRTCLLLTLAACGGSGGASNPGDANIDPRGHGGALPSSFFPCTEQGMRDAIAEGGGPHGFSCDGPTTVVSKARIVIDKDVILDGLRELTVDGDAKHLVFSVREGVTAELRRMTVTGGDSSGRAGGIENHGALTIDDSTVSNNSGYEVGGVWNGYAAWLTLRRSTVSGNIGNSVGGVQNDGTMHVFDSTVSGNAGNAGGIDNYGTSRLERSAVSDNDGDEVGAIRNSDGGMVIIDHGTVSHNDADAVGGILNGDGRLTIRDSRISDNSGDLVGAIWNHEGGTVTVAQSTVLENSGQQTGGIRNDDQGTVTLKGSIITDHCQGDITSNGDNMMEHQGETCCGFDESKGDADRLAIPFF